MSNTVPEGWRISTIDEFAKTSAGGTPSTQNHKYWEEGKIPWMSSGEVHKKHVSQVDQYITQLGFDNSSAKLFPPKTLLIALAGQGKTRGTVAISEIELTTNQSIAGVMIKDSSVSPDYVFQNLDSRYEELRCVSGGSGRAGLNLSIIGEQEVLLPPLPEQQKIAAILSSVDDVIEKTQAQIDKLKDLKTGMMQELLTKGVCDGNGKCHTEFKDSPVGRIPVGWEVKSVGEIAYVTKLAGFEYTNYFDYSVGGEIIAVRALNLTNGKLDLRNIQTIPQSVSDSLPRSKLYQGDILITYVGVNIGELGIVDKDDRYHLAPNVGKISFDSNVVYPNFMFQQMLSRPVQNAIKNLTSVTSQPSLNMGNIRSIPVVTMPMDEQKKITKILSSIDTKHDQVNEKLTSLNDLKKALMQDLLTGSVRVKVD